MRILGFDTSSLVTAIAVTDGDRVLAHDDRSSEQRHAEVLLPRIEAALASAQVGLSAIELIAVGIGPGSFTGLRVGLATAKGLALATKIPLCGVSSLRVLARGVASRAEVVLAALDAGKHVLCEKPLANTVAEAEAMAAAAQRAQAHGAAAMAGFNYRRVPAIALARRLIAEGRLGQIHHFRGVYLNDRLVDPQAPRTWRHDRAQAGGGAVTDLGSHMIDLARFLVGEMTEVAADLRTFIAERPLPDGAGIAPVDVDDAATALLRFAGGAMGTLEVSRFGTGHRNYNCFELSGSAGSLAFNLERLNELSLFDRADRTLAGFRTLLVTERDHPYLAAWWPPGHTLGWEHTFIHAARDLIHGIATGEPVSPDFEDGLRAQRVIDAIQRAALSRRWETVPET